MPAITYSKCEYEQCSNLLLGNGYCVFHCGITRYKHLPDIHQKDEYMKVNKDSKKTKALKELRDLGFLTDEFKLAKIYRSGGYISRAADKAYDGL